MTDKATGASAPSFPLEFTLRYAHTVGALAPYFDGLAQGAAVATRCPDCRRAWFAPRLVCACGCRNPDWVALPGRGTIVAVTRGRLRFPATAIAGDFTFALIGMDGADNRCVGRLDEINAELRRGDRVMLQCAEGDWAHPAQRALFVAAPKGTPRA